MVASVSVDAVCFAVVSLISTFVNVSTATNPVDVVPLFTVDTTLKATVCVDTNFGAPPMTVVASMIALVTVDTAAVIVKFISRFAKASITSISVKAPFICCAWISIAFIDINTCAIIILDVSSFALADKAAWSIDTDFRVPPVTVVSLVVAFINVNAFAEAVFLISFSTFARIASVCIATVFVVGTWIEGAFVYINTITTDIFDVAIFAFAFVAAICIDTDFVSTTGEYIVAFVLVATDSAEASNESGFAVTSEPTA